jgi:hypothetical protein
VNGQSLIWGKKRVISAIILHKNRVYSKMEGKKYSYGKL